MQKKNVGGTKREKKQQQREGKRIGRAESQPIQRKNGLAPWEEREDDQEKPGTVNASVNSWVLVFGGERKRISPMKNSSPG